MYKKSVEKSEEIVKLYREGVILTKICELTTSSQLTTKKVLASYGIDYDQEEKLKYQEKLLQIPILYKEGKSQNYIEQQLKLTRKTIRELLLGTDLQYRDKSEQHHIRYETELNHNCFDELTPEALYWIGLLYTDGHIEKKEASIEVVLHGQDINHLEKFRQFLGCSREVKKGGGNCYRLRFNSKRIWFRLQELGFTHNKSKIIIPHPLLRDSRDFWRGCIDGDGGVYNYIGKFKGGTRQVGLCGTFDTISYFCSFCSDNMDVQFKKPSKASGLNLYQISYYGQEAIKVGILLYDEATIYLERKYKVYSEELVN